MAHTVGIGEIADWVYSSPCHSSVAEMDGGGETPGQGYSVAHDAAEGVDSACLDLNVDDESEAAEQD